jgi:predicted SAM-dependent methyltransferase
MKLLNIGCGSVFHPNWENVDIVSSSPEVREYDISRNLPYPDAEFDVCYSSHLLEHLAQQEAENFIAECYRILKPNGIIRVVVPDLESIASNYLTLLEQVDSGNQEVESNYDWMMLELYDQTVRSFSGGNMGKFLLNPNINNKDFVLSRIGAEAKNHWEINPPERSTWREKITTKKICLQIEKTRIKIAGLLVALVAGKKSMEAFQEGVFRNSGEIHRWMYDRYSLRRLLERAGFSDIRICEASMSKISDFNIYSLDVVDNQTRKPDSLFVEATRL